jgi:hypothetical protein
MRKISRDFFEKKISAKFLGKETNMLQDFMHVIEDTAENVVQVANASLDDEPVDAGATLVS